MQRLHDVIAQVFPAQGVFALGQHGAGRAQHTGVLAQVAGPGVGGQALQQVRRHLHGVGQTLLGGQVGQQLLRQGGEVGALAQGGQLHRQAVEAVVQVVPEAPLLGRLQQLAMRGADEAKVHRHGVACAHGRHAAVLQHAQQAGLQGQRHIADFIQEQRAAVGLAQAAQAAFLAGTGEGASHMAEQFGFDEVLGDGRAVDGHEGPGAAWAAGVQGARKHFLAHARFALDEHRNGLAHHAAGLVGGGTPAGVARVEPGQGVIGGLIRGRGTRHATHHAGGGPGGSVELHLRIQQRPAAQAQGLGLLGAAVVMREQVIQPHVQHLCQRGGAHVAHVQAQLGEGHAVGAHDPAIGRHGHDAFGHAANALGLAVQV